MNKKLILTCVLLLVGVVAGVLYVDKGSSRNNVPQQPEPQEQAKVAEIVDTMAINEVTVKIKNFEYIPQKITIKTGTKVTWINEDDMQHNAMLDHDDSEVPHDATLGTDTHKFEGPMLAKGESYSYIFSTPSTNPYHCAPHPWMKGVVEVTQ